jgi:hypothetical protein
MNLPEFVRVSLLDIVAAIQEADAEITRLGGVLNPAHRSIGGATVGRPYGVVLSGQPGLVDRSERPPRGLLGAFSFVGASMAPGNAVANDRPWSELPLSDRRQELETLGGVQFPGSTTYCGGGVE